MNNAVKAYYRAYQSTFKVAMHVFDWSEPEMLEGPGAIKRLPKFIKSKGITNVLVVTGDEYENPSSSFAVESNGFERTATSLPPNTENVSLKSPSTASSFLLPLGLK